MKTCPTCQGSYPHNFAVCPQDGTPLQDIGGWAEGSVIRGKYRILSKVGQGGMGAVYKALHLAFDELRALKVIAPELLHDDLFVKRFKHEAVITRKLQHPNAVRVDDIDEAEDGRPFIVMEFIQGRSLKQLIQEAGPLPFPRVCSIIKQVASALEAAHCMGMVHRDIKPDNIALIESTEGELVKVLDFGIAKLKEARLGAEAGLTLTGTGVVIGTPQYMSPEQAMGKRGDELDGRSDLYSLGVVMYEMLTADLPFHADTTMGMLLAHIQQPPMPIRTLHPELQIPEPIASLAMRLLEKQPTRRPANGRELIEELEAVEKGIAPLPGRGVMDPTAVLSRKEIPGTPEADRPVPVKSKPVTVGSVGPPSPPVVQSQVVIPRTPAAILPIPEPEKESRWGIWVGIVVLLVGLGAGGWYITSQHSSSLNTTPVSTTPGQGSGASPVSPSQSFSIGQNPPATGISSPGSSPQVQTAPGISAPELSERKTQVAQPTQNGPAGGGSGTATSGVNITPVRTAVEPKRIKSAITLGDFFYKDAEYDKAIKAYQEGLDLDPSNPDLLNRLERARKAEAAEERVLH